MCFSKLNSAEMKKVRHTLRRFAVLHPSRRKLPAWPKNKMRAVPRAEPSKCASSRLKLSHLIAQTKTWTLRHLTEPK